MKSNSVHEEMLHGYKIKIFPDDMGINPYTDWDCASILVTWNRDNYWHKDGKKEFGDPANFLKWAKANKAIVIPVYLYSHSGTTIKASENGDPFSCPWDSGQVGFAYMTRKKAIEEFAVKGKTLTNTIIDKAKALIITEIECLDDCMTGNVYGFVITNPDGEEDSCWGFIGDYSYCLNEARESVNYKVEYNKKEKEKADEEAMTEICMNPIYA